MGWDTLVLCYVVLCRSNQKWGMGYISTTDIGELSPWNLIVAIGRNERFCNTACL